jgi:hypothetical protein
MTTSSRIKKLILAGTRQLLFGKKYQKKKILLITIGATRDKIEEIKRRIRFFDNELQITETVHLSFFQHLNFSLVGFASSPATFPHKLMQRLKYDQTYNFDYEMNAAEGWEYHRMLSCLYVAQKTQAILKGKEQLMILRQQSSDKFEKAYVFGTGPSLDKAKTMNWKDGFRIVSNTIVKDKELWHHLAPHIIVAGDANYHFGISGFAKRFRKDLNQRLKETPSALFIFPSVFYPFCLNEFPELSDRLIPVPVGFRPGIHSGLINQYLLPTVGNVLPSMLLPVACTFSNHIYLWGFDGRAPGDQMFWSNSSNQFYSDDVPELIKLHPAFFRKQIPEGREDEYVKRVHGDVLETLLSNAEHHGFSFTMMHFSHTPVLQKRILKEG